MLVRQLVPSSGSEGVRKPGDVYETDDAEGARIIAAGHAERVQVAPAGKPVDTATKRPPQRRG